MRTHLIIAAAALALVACERTSQGPVGAAQTAGAAKGETRPADPAADPIDGDASSAWIELAGSWAEIGRCDDDRNLWIIEAEAFHLYEMHCAVETLDLLRNGVKAAAQCTIEGYDDGVTDIFWFLRQADASLTIVEGANQAMKPGLFLCESDETDI